MRSFGEQEFRPAEVLQGVRWSTGACDDGHQDDLALVRKVDETLRFGMPQHIRTSRRALGEIRPWRGGVRADSERAFVDVP